MDLTASSVLRAGAAAVFPAVADLATYPTWLRIVLRAVAGEPRVAGDRSDSAGGADADGDPVWLVDIGARLGPLRKSKRLRMVRTLHEPPHRVRFERIEADGRDHSPWVLEGRVEAEPSGTRLSMQLHYGGAAWLPLLDRVLAEEVRRAPARLDRYLGS